MSEISKRDTGCRSINIIIIYQKMLAEAIERIRSLMDKIKGKKRFRIYFETRTRKKK